MNDIHDGEPLYSLFEPADWALLQLRYLEQPGWDDFQVNPIGLSWTPPMNPKLTLATSPSSAYNYLAVRLGWRISGFPFSCLNNDILYTQIYPCFFDGKWGMPVMFSSDSSFGAQLPPEFTWDFSSSCLVVFFKSGSNSKNFFHQTGFPWHLGMRSTCFKRRSRRMWTIQTVPETANCCWGLVFACDNSVKVEKCIWSQPWNGRVTTGIKTNRPKKPAGNDGVENSSWYSYLAYQIIFI